jgi:hypothetical protein
MKAVWNVAGELALDAAHAWPLVRDALSTVAITRAETLGGLALVVAFECEREDVPVVLARLREAGVRVTDGERAPSGAEVMGMLHVTLAHGGPDERVEIPKVPG